MSGFNYGRRSSYDHRPRSTFGSNNNVAMDDGLELDEQYKSIASQHDAFGYGNNVNIPSVKTGGTQYVVVNNVQMWEGARGSFGFGSDSFAALPMMQQQMTNGNLLTSNTYSASASASFAATASASSSSPSYPALPYHQTTYAPQASSPSYPASHISDLSNPMSSTGISLPLLSTMDKAKSNKNIPTCDENTYYTYDNE